MEIPVQINLNMLSDEQLRSLSTAIYTEQKQRIMQNINKYPIPNALTDNAINDYRAYHSQHDTSLMEAKMVVDHYRRIHDIEQKMGIKKSDLSTTR